jgi:hypothetical protein
VGMMLCRWKYNLMNEKTKDKRQEENYRPFNSARVHKECKDQGGLKAKLIFLGSFYNLASICFVFFVGDVKDKLIELFYVFFAFFNAL